MAYPLLNEFKGLNLNNIDDDNIAYPSLNSKENVLSPKYYLPVGNTSDSIEKANEIINNNKKEVSAPQLEDEGPYNPLESLSEHEIRAHQSIENTLGESGRELTQYGDEKSIEELFLLHKQCLTPNQKEDLLKGNLNTSIFTKKAQILQTEVNKALLKELNIDFKKIKNAKISTLDLKLFIGFDSFRDFVDAGITLNDMSNSEGLYTIPLFRILYNLNIKDIEQHFDIKAVDIARKQIFSTKDLFYLGCNMDYLIFQGFNTADLLTTSYNIKELSDNLGLGTKHHIETLKMGDISSEHFGIYKMYFIEMVGRIYPDVSVVQYVVNDFNQKKKTKSLIEKQTQQNIKIKSRYGVTSKKIYYN